MVKALSFKGDKKAKKRKRADESTTPHADSADVASGKELKLAENEAEDDDSWVSADVLADVTGPIMLVMPTEPPSALACDANGKVFTIEIENIVDANPTTAEPHDVRQVWVASKIVGTEYYRFKGHHSRYLGCDNLGILSATAEAVTPLESFTLIAAADGLGFFSIQTVRDTFLSVKAPALGKIKAASEVRGDATESSFDTTFRIRMQAKFKPRLKANKEEKAREKISRKELEVAVGRRLEEDEVKTLKRARREGDYHEKLLDFKVKNKHDKYS